MIYKNRASNAEDPLPGSILGKGMKLVFSFTLTAVVAVGLNPHLAESVGDLVDVERIEVAQVEKNDREEILWFARAVYSESEFIEEQYYVAWAIRERVNSAKFADTYKEVVLQPHQFSGLNSYDNWYELNISRDYGVGDHVWESALTVATEVYSAPDTERLLPVGTTHFYSPVAVAPPEWTWGHVPVETLYGSKGARFAFYAGVK